MFVIDSSGSIGAESYQTIRGYVYNFTEGLFSGDSESRVGLILHGTVDINLDFVSSSGKMALLEKIRNLPHKGKSTDTPKAFCLLRGVNWRESISVLKSVVVLTDSKLNQYPTSCDGQLGTSVSSVNSLAEEMHPPVITVFTVGASGYQLNEELQVTTAPDVPDYRLLLQNQQFYIHFICNKSKMLQT